jgi:hypothetical protein
VISWSNTKIVDDPVGRSFWAGIEWLCELGRPAYCTDMVSTTGLARELLPALR